MQCGVIGFHGHNILLVRNMIDLNRKALKFFGHVRLSSHDVLLSKSSSNLVNLYLVLSALSS
jgi:hypothetical protein